MTKNTQTRINEQRVHDIIDAMSLMLGSCTQKGEYKEAMVALAVMFRWLFNLPTSLLDIMEVMKAANTFPMDTLGTNPSGLPIPVLGLHDQENLCECGMVHLDGASTLLAALTQSESSPPPGQFPPEVQQAIDAIEKALSDVGLEGEVLEVRTRDTPRNLN